MKRLIMKSFLPLLLLVLALTSCKKEENIHPVPESTCLFATTDISYSELDLSQANSGDLFIMNLDVNDDANGLQFDLNCDGIDDVYIYAGANNYYPLYSSNLYSKVSIAALNSNTFLLRDSIADSTFHVNTWDTTGSLITEYDLTTSYTVNGSVLTEEMTYFFVTNVDSTAVIMGNDPRWSNMNGNNIEFQTVRFRRLNTSTYSWGPDSNGFMREGTHVVDYKRGIAPDQEISWIPIKFVTDEGNVKMGFIKLKPQLYDGAAEVGVECWGIQP